MRSYPFVKRTLPCLAVIVALSSTSPAYAAKDGFFGKLKSAATHFINAATKPGGPTKVVQPETKQDASTAQKNAYMSMDVSLDSVAEEKQPFSFEKDFVVKAMEATNKKAWNSSDLRRSATGLLEKAESVSTATHTEIIPEYTKDGLVFRLRYDEKALQNKDSLIRDVALITALTKNGGYGVFESVYMNTSVSAEIESPHSIAELMTNAREGSPTAQARLNLLFSKILEQLRLSQSMVTDMGLTQDVLKDQANQLKDRQAALDELAAKHQRKQQKALDAWKSDTGALDKLEAMNEKLDDLILKNDRKGVRKMLEAYLPWAVMEPVEANTWKIWLEAIENPNHEKSVIAFRGLKYDTDKIQRKQTAQGEVFGFMSTVLTKNQGSYTRRLRSLSTNREKNGDVSFNRLSQEKSSDVRSIRITDQMTSHARDPKASSFISFTYDPNVAYRFMGNDVTKQIKGESVTVPYGGILVVKMDARRMIPNVPSMYGTEIELLAPLIVFPDEVVKYKEGSFKSGEYATFVKEISEKTGVNFAQWNTAKDGNDESLKERYNRDGHEFLKQMIDTKYLKAMSCSKVF
ncbi:hypothetical protein ACLWBD_08950 [Bdellovibrio sp. HCB117]|uniref:hypothetical protein n=1 Tax=Bdellovibrio sp. HCB117 TaxID=3394359 RepID=UPI0039B60651